MISIDLERPDAGFQPGEKIRGTIACKLLGQQVEKIEVQLVWMTVGRGSFEEGVASAVTLDQPSSREQVDEGPSSHGAWSPENWEFEFDAPLRPYSFSGRLISLEWEIRVFPKPGKLTHTTRITIGPNREQVLLPPIETNFSSIKERLQKILTRR